MRTQLTLLGLIAGGCIAILVYLVLKLRTTPEERERRRRLEVNRHGRMADGMVIEADEETLQYQYTVRGVDYVTSQDIRTLTLPGEVREAIGPVTLKYSTNNPANSIVVCEDWSGLRRRSGTANSTP